MLGTRLSLELKFQPFVASSLGHRVLNESDNGNAMLISIRRVAHRLQSVEISYPRSISSLCKLAASNVRRIFSSNPSFVGSMRQEDFNVHCQAAAVYLNSLYEIDKWETPRVESAIFGSSFELAFRFGSMDMIDRYLNDTYWENRSPGLSRVARHIRGLAIFQHVFRYRIADLSWCFIRDGRYTSERVQLGYALKTPDPARWEFIMDLHRLGNNGSTSPCVWHRSERVCSSGSRSSHIFCGFQQGHTAIVQLLLGYGARTLAAITIAAAWSGHTAVVQSLIRRGADQKGALVAAARKGDGDIVRVLLEIDADPDEAGTELSAIGYASTTLG
ncbi:hypothetical protein EK21DRAFT_89572 [Setomelanomma holmii]|uniref:Uncharacterized protein n=1 Tax=Setomelanomma holmii TaxID=210430 RepID=A0A9P4LLA9_9PLEO|nr:hypothetical protein EK21DRAFT_89572 [Setomelanomma holmii]